MHPTASSRLGAPHHMLVTPSVTTRAMSAHDDNEPG